MRFILGGIINVCVSLGVYALLMQTDIYSGFWYVAGMIVSIVIGGIAKGI